jgi:uncharacterized protein YceK
MKGIRSSVLVVATCIGLGGCAEVVQLIPLAVRGAQETNAERNVTKSDAGVAKLILATPTTPEIFVANVRAAVLRLGYQIKSIQGAGNTQIVMAMKQKMDTGFQLPWMRRDTTYNIATIRLEQDAKTINVSLSNASNTGEGEPGAAEKVADEFKDALQKLYTVNK